MSEACGTGNKEQRYMQLSVNKVLLQLTKKVSLQFKMSTCLCKYKAQWYKVELVGWKYSGEQYDQPLLVMNATQVSVKRRKSQKLW